MGAIRAARLAEFLLGDIFISLKFQAKMIPMTPSCRIPHYFRAAFGCVSAHCEVNSLVQRRSVIIDGSMSLRTHVFFVKLRWDIREWKLNSVTLEIFSDLSLEYKAFLIKLDKGLLKHAKRFSHLIIREYLIPSRTFHHRSYWRRSYCLESALKNLINGETPRFGLLPAPPSFHGAFYSIQSLSLSAVFAPLSEHLTHDGS